MNFVCYFTFVHFLEAWISPYFFQCLCNQLTLNGDTKKKLHLTFTPLTLLWWEQFLLSNTHFVHHTWCCSSSTVPILGAFGNTLGERTGSLWPFGNSLLKFTVWKFRNQCQCTRRSDLGYDAPVCQVAQAGNWLRTEAAFGKHFEWTLLCLSEHTPSE